MNNRDLIIALSTSPSISAKMITRIIALNSRVKEDCSNLKYPDGFGGGEIASNLIKNRVHEDVRQKCNKKDIKIITFLDDKYPDLLREIPDFPPVIYVRGNAKLLKNQNVIAVVGSRRPSSYGLFHTAKTVKELSAHFVIVSGLAIGIDGQAHKSCLEAGGQTIAVLGTPIDCFYPASNELLGKKIISSGGLIVSEYPPGFPVSRYNFPLRNRIIAGLSRATLVMEAAKGSGSLITASLALDYNREVFALPGNADSTLSFGTNILIRNGANILLNSMDVCLSLGIDEVNLAQQNLKNLTQDQRIVVSALQAEPLAFDKIQNLTKIDVAVLGGLLGELEVQKVISRRLDGDYILLTGLNI